MVLSSAAAIAIGHGLCAFGQIVGEEHNFAQLPIHLDLGHYPVQFDRVPLAIASSECAPEGIHISPEILQGHASQTSLH